MTNEEVLDKTLAAVTEKFEKVKGETVSKAEYDALKTEIEKVKGMQNTTELEAKLAEKIKGFEQGLFDMSAKLENQSGAKTVSLSEMLAPAVQKVKSLQGNGMVSVGEIEKTKAATNMTLGVSAVGVPVADTVPGIKLIPRNTFVLRALSMTGSNTSGIVRWIEEEDPQGAAAMTGEGLTKSKVSAKLTPRTADAKKLTAFIKVSTEMLDDIAQLESYINGKLMYEIDKEEETQLLTGNGLALNLNGITKYAKGLELLTVKNYFALNASNRWDAIGAALAQIGEANHEANVVIMRKSDIFLMTNGSRTTTGEYNYPVTVTPDGTFVYGVRVIASNTIPAGYFLAADMNKFNISDRQTLSIMMGYDGNDFTENFVTIRAEKRLATFAASEDAYAFVYETFADAKLWLEKNT